MSEKRVFECILGDGITPQEIEEYLLAAEHVHHDEDFEPEDLKDVLKHPDWKRVRITIEPLPVAHSSKADEICPVAKKPHPVYSMTYGCNLCGKTVWGDGHTMEYPPPKEWLETPPGPVADDSNGGSP
jgi:hypothetical protein